jgi:hypothetical protein
MTGTAISDGQCDLPKVTMRVIRAHLWVWALLVLVTVTLTYPVALGAVHGATLPGLKDFDEFEYVWLMWWYDASLVQRHVDPADLPFYYPMQTNQPLVTVTPLGWLFAVPMVSLLGPIAAYNVFWLLNFVLCGYTAYLLALWLSRLRHAALIAGLIFAFYPGKMLHGLGHFGDMMIFVFPLYVLFLLRLIQGPNARRAAQFAAVTCLGLLIDFRHIGLFYLPLTVVILVYQALTDRRRLLSGRFLKWAVLAAVGVTVVIAPVVGPFVLSSLGGQLGSLKEGGLDASSADLLSFALPPMTHPLLGQIPGLKQLMQTVWTQSLYIETALYLGVTAVALAIMGLIKRRRGAWLWAWVVMVGAILALGPRLKVAGQPVGSFPLPYAFLNRLPFYEWVRIPGRLDMMIKLALAMGAALGAAAWLHGKSPSKRAVFTTLVSVFVLFEYLTFVPYPTVGIQPSPFLQRLAGDGQDYGILHIASHEYSMYLQTLHGHSMVEGHIHRWPPGGIEWALQLHNLALYPVTTEQAYYDILDEDHLPYGRDGGWVFSGSLNLSPAALLAEQGIRYVVFDRKGPWTRPDRDLYASRLQAYFGAPVEQDSRLNIYDVRAIGSGGARLLPGEGWYPLEGAEHDLWRWTQGAADLRIAGATPGLYRLKLAMRPFRKGQSAQVMLEGKLLGEYTLDGPTEIVTPPFTLGAAPALIRLATPEGCRTPFDWLRGNLDGRCLGLAVSEVRLFPALAQPENFGDQLQLLGYEIVHGLGPDANVYLSLYWRSMERAVRDYTVFVHDVDSNGATLAQDDTQLRNRRGFPTLSWQPGDAARSFHRLPAHAGASLKVGVYDLQTMDRLPLQGSSNSENVVILSSS